MTYEEYKTIRHSTPFTFELHKPHQTLFYFGANHSCDQNDKQFKELESFWNKFLNQTKGKNCIILVEGAIRPVCSNKINAITMAGGEGGLITFLAHKANIFTQCPEPDEKYLLGELLKNFSQEEIAYKNFAQNVLQYNRYKKVRANLDFSVYIQRYLLQDQQHFTFPLTLEKFKQIHQELFKQMDFRADDEQFFYRITNPVIQETLINKICRQASIIRDTHIVNFIHNLIKQGKNIFVVYGCTHAVMQEKALKNLWNENNLS